MKLILEARCASKWRYNVIYDLRSTGTVSVKRKECGLSSSKFSLSTYLFYAVRILCIFTGQLWCGWRKFLPRALNTRSTKLLSPHAECYKEIILCDSLLVDLRSRIPPDQKRSCIIFTFSAAPDAIENSLIDF